MKIYELSAKSDDLRKEKLNEVIKILKIGYNERGAGDIYRVFDKDEDALKEKYLWNIVENDNGTIVGVEIFNGDENDRKVSLISTKAEFNPDTNKWETTSEAKEALKMFLEDFKPENKDRHVWGEFSGAMEHILVDKNNIKPLPLNEAVAIMEAKGKIVERASDNIHYARQIGSEIEHKVIIGNVPDKYRVKQNYEISKTVLNTLKEASTTEKLQIAFVESQLNSDVRYSLEEYQKENNSNYSNERLENVEDTKQNMLEKFDDGAEKNYDGFDDIE